MYRQTEHQYYLKSIVKEGMEHIQGRVGKGILRQQEKGGEGQKERDRLGMMSRKWRDKRTGTDWE